MRRNVTRPGGRGWAYAGTLLGAFVSIAANIAHSFVPPTTLPVDPATGGPADWSPPVGAVLGTTFWPVALFVAVEMLARTPWRPGARWVLLRWVGIVPVAFVAAFVSYRHLSGLLAFYGEDHITATLGPLAVDGLMVMATGALIATAPTGSAATADAAAQRVAVPGTSVPDVEVLSAPETSPGERASEDCSGDPSSSSPRRAPQAVRAAGGRGKTGERVVRAKARHPEWSAAQLAERLGLHERTVRRYLTAATSENPSSGAAQASDDLDDSAAQERAA